MAERVQRAIVVIAVTISVIVPLANSASAGGLAAPLFRLCGRGRRPDVRTVNRQLRRIGMGRLTSNRTAIDVCDRRIVSVH